MLHIAWSERQQHAMVIIKEIIHFGCRGTRSKTFLARVYHSLVVLGWGLLVAEFYGSATGSLVECKCSVYSMELGGNEFFLCF